MSRDKQIEEMAKLLEKDCGRCFNCDALLKTPLGIACTDYYHAMQLYNAGYRKQSEVAEEIFAEIDRMCIDTFGNFNHRVFAELKKKYTEGK